MANANVHTGFWIDHTRGHVLGSTITLETKYGSQLVSAAAIVVQLIGIATWTIVAFVIHQRRATSSARDEFDAQVQVTLRNTAGAESATWNLIKLGRAWRNRRPHLFRDATILAVLPALIYIAFIVAGVFVGQIATNAYDTTNVLLGNGTCGWITADDSDASINGFGHVTINVSTVAKQYAQSCYADGVSAISCSVYPVPKLDYTISSNESCPIPGDEVCFDDEIVTLTTKIDSHHDLGINAPEKDRLSLQYKTTCAPLNYDFVDSIIEREVDTIIAENKTVEAEGYMIGHFVGLDKPYPYYYYPIMRQIAVGTIGYSVSAFQSLAPHANVTSGWAPVVPFNQSNGDLSLFLESPNGITFTERVRDPMFRTYSTPNSTITGPAPYVPMRDVYMLACTEHWQICNPSNEKCTGWSPVIGIIGQLDDWEDRLDLNSQQNATLTRLANSIFDANMFAAVNGVPDPLQASSYLSSGSGSQPLPNGFWKQEVESWFQAVLAKLQYLQVVYANIPLAIVEANYIKVLEPETDALRDQCKQQRITAPAKYQSYNFFALLLIAILGVLIPGISVVLKGLHHKLPFVNPKGYRFVSYQAEGTLQLHRQVLEGSGYDGWEDGMKDIPTTVRAKRRIPQAILETDEIHGSPTSRYPKREAGDDESDEGGKGSDGTEYQEVEKDDRSD